MSKTLVSSLILKQGICFIWNCFLGYNKTWPHLCIWHFFEGVLPRYSRRNCWMLLYICYPHNINILLLKGEKFPDGLNITLFGELCPGFEPKVSVDCWSYFHFWITIILQNMKRTVKIHFLMGCRYPSLAPGL